jgi:uncharacterized repeat protein (TIGR03803 family)
MEKKMHPLVTLALSVILLTFTNAAWAQTEKVIYSFTGGTDGGEPEGGVIVDAKGNLYGTTQSGGAGGAGTVFELTPNSDGTWTEQVIHSFVFNGADGGLPFSSLTFDSKGNLYGMTVAGGAAEGGTVFELSPGSNGVWNEQILFSFNGGSDGGSLDGGKLTLDGSGNIYGTCFSGGAYGFGVVFELTPGSNGIWTETILHSFAGGNDGSGPLNESLALDADGNVYGITSVGGPYDYGVVFELLHGSNGTWTEKILHAFTGGADASNPSGGLIFDASHNLYGASFYYAFELSTGSNGAWTEKQIHQFTGGSDGAYPESALVFDKAGNLYGTTSDGGFHRGTVFELIPGPDGTWTEKILHKFSPTGGDGVFPAYPALAISLNGTLYGTTQSGGASNEGVVFAVKP